MSEVTEWEFYSVTDRAKVRRPVEGKVTYVRQTSKGERKSYAFRGKTTGGKSLTAFVGEDVYNRSDAGEQVIRK